MSSTGLNEPIIATPRLRLRAVEEADAAATSSLVTPEITANLSTWTSPMSLADALAKIHRSIAHRRDRQALDFAILRKEDEQLLGWIGLQKLDSARARLGYWLGQQFRGRGLTLEAATHAIPVACEFLQVEIVEALVLRWNQPSIRIVEALGFSAAGAEDCHLAQSGNVESALKFVLRVTRDPES
jgi:RimJ/RimL family protein N-acetyltransferase